MRVFEVRLSPVLVEEGRASGRYRVSRAALRPLWYSWAAPRHSTQLLLLQTLHCKAKGKVVNVFLSPSSLLPFIPLGESLTWSIKPYLGSSYMPNDHRLGLPACASLCIHLSSVAGYTPGPEGAPEFELSGQAGTQALMVYLQRVPQPSAPFYYCHLGCLSSSHPRSYLH